MNQLFTKAKERFEQIVTKMQADLKKKALSGTDPKFLNYRKAELNALVDFYEQVLAHIDAIEELNVENELKYSVLHRDSEKLVVYAQMHGINPNEVFLWTIEELTEMQQARMYFKPQAIPFEDYPMDNDLTNKYLEVRTIARGGNYA